MRKEFIFLRTKLECFVLESCLEENLGRISKKKDLTSHYYNLILFQVCQASH